jgi:MbtH protein
MSSGDEDLRTYTVVMNAEEQYSVWLAESPIPEGWSEVGKRGSKAECLAHIGVVWTDMRPLSLRRWLAEREPNGDARAR